MYLNYSPLQTNKDLDTLLDRIEMHNMFYWVKHLMEHLNSTNGVSKYQND